MSSPSDRRGFLRGLVSLPLIGGGVTLIGSPSAVAAPVTGGMLATYIAWLHFEERYVRWGCNAENFVPMMNPGACFHTRSRVHPNLSAREALMRAPLILAAAGCQLSCAEAEAQSGNLGSRNWRDLGQ